MLENSAPSGRANRMMQPAGPRETRPETEYHLARAGKPNLDVSVLVLSHERPQFLRQAVASVLGQSKLPSTITILDNGSGPDVRQAVADFLAQGVRWEGSDVTRSGLWNIQRALDRGNSEYLYVMHDDDRLCPSFLETQVKFMEENGRAVAVACGAHKIDSAGKRIGSFGRGSNDEIRWVNSGAELALLYSRADGPPYPSVVYRTSCARRVRIRPEFGKVTDVVFLCELADVGPIAYRSTELLEYRIHSGQDSAIISDQVLCKLLDFLILESSSNPMMAKMVRRNFQTLQTGRYMSNWIINFRKDRSFNSVMDAVRMPIKRYFSFKAAIRWLIAAYIRHRRSSLT